jgi:hypothetical protein
MDVSIPFVGQSPESVREPHRAVGRGSAVARLSDSAALRAKSANTAHGSLYDNTGFVFHPLKNPEFSISG